MEAAKKDGDAPRWRAPPSPSALRARRAATTPPRCATSASPRDRVRRCRRRRDAPAAKLQEKLLAVADGYAAGGDAAAALELFKRLLKEFVVLG